MKEAAMSFSGTIRGVIVFLLAADRPKTCNVSLSPRGKVEEGKPVTLTCRSDANPAAQYTFYKHNHSLTVGSGEVYPFHSVSSEDRANYFCKCENKYGNHTSSPLFLDILYAPKLPVVSVTPGEIMEGSLVTLTCLSNANPAASYRWYRENDNNPLSLRENLNLNNVNSSASGRYYCSAWNNLGKKTSTVNIDVKYAPRSLSVSIIPAGKTTKGSSVTLTCSCDANPAALYVWYKEGHESDKTSGQNFIIENIQQEHSGDYHCKVQNSLGYQNATISVIVVAGPSKLAVIGTMVFIFLIVIFLIVFFLLR
ncbi:PREDICTED: B-cell receptor CD22-like [Cyprinodon variegatus]|uniref:B-cell receptor CD22-like n=1 Tax=Cyprinodon variegatus TaxID=28743 RepID=UPI00074270A7|nr:PREDICTED: B-cell receptor CD22-like [Cyprinodon variegatus]